MSTLWKKALLQRLNAGEAYPVPHSHCNTCPVIPLSKLIHINVALSGLLCISGCIFMFYIFIIHILLFHTQEENRRHASSCAPELLCVM